MPISNNASYVPTMNEFAAHWATVNATLPDALTVVTETNTSMDRSQFVALRQTLQTEGSAVIDALNDQQIARGNINIQKTLLLAMLNEFNALLDAYWLNTGFHNARPKAPSLSDGEGRFMDPMRDMASLWVKVNANPAPPGIVLPLTLAAGTVVAEAQTRVVNLQDAYVMEKNAAQDVALTRAQREETKALAYATMKGYRLAVQSRAVLNPSLIATLPALTPSGGHTPTPVNASAVFEAPDKSKVVYSESTDADLARYELRGNPGEAYDEQDAVVIETHTPEEAREFLSTFGLTQPGAQVALKVYVVLTMGNEAGSATMTVTRPG